MFVRDLLKSSFVGMGGHNFLPPDDSAVAAAVAVSPGGPAHVMLTDRQAEHIPGCNMVFYKWALEEIGGFDPIFHRAGDDVDVCWRLQQRGYKIGFSPPGFVWHYRRSTIGAYLAQQRGYGEAEAMLVRRHPEYFNMLGGSIWQGRIYTASKFGLTVRQPIIYRGVFATGFFQSVYRAEPAMALMLFTSLEYHAVINLPLAALSIAFGALAPIALTSILTSLGVCVAAGAQAELPRSRRRWWSRPMVAALFFLQPIVRGWARYQGRLALGPTPKAAVESLESLALQEADDLERVEYWADQGLERVTFVRRIIDKLEEQGWEIKVGRGLERFRRRNPRQPLGLPAIGDGGGAARRREADAAVPVADRLVAAGEDRDFLARVLRFDGDRVCLAGVVADLVSAFKRFRRLRGTCGGTSAICSA